MSSWQQYNITCIRDAKKRIKIKLKTTIQNYLCNGGLLCVCDAPRFQHFSNDERYKNGSLMCSIEYKNAIHKRNTPSSENRMPIENKKYEMEEKYIIIKKKRFEENNEVKAFPISHLSA